MRIESKAQFYQDFFVWQITNGQVGGFFLDIGAGVGGNIPNGNNPGFYSNTYFLEQHMGWGGIALDYDKRWCDFVSVYRPKTKVICKDLMKVNINDVLSAHGCPSKIDYLSFDVDDAQEKVFNELDFDKYKFKIITYEHNLFHSYPNCDQMHTKEHKDKTVLRHKKDQAKLKRLGYYPLWENVGEWADRPVEDWYVNEELFEKYKHAHKKVVATKSSKFMDQLMALKG